jgi:hypothetical protein
VSQVGVNALRLQIFDVKVSQIVMRHFARVESFASQLRQSHDGIACRATTCLSWLNVVYMA